MPELTMTAIEMREAGACYTLSKLEDLWGERDRLTALEILDLDIPDEDKLWGVLRESLVPETTLGEIVCRFAEWALANEVAEGRTPDVRSYAAIDARRQYERGEITAENLSAAWAAARAAAESAAESAAWAALVELVRTALTEGHN